MNSYRSDASLLERCRAGDAAAWELLVARYRRLVWSVILKHRMSDEAREDAFQQVFSALIEHIDDIREEAALASWIATTTRRVCWRNSALAKRDTARASSLDANDERPLQVADDAMEGGDFQVLTDRQLVRTGLERLGGKCQELLETLFGATGEPNYTVIAAKLGIRVGSIGPTRARCLEKLAAVLERLGFHSKD